MQKISPSFFFSLITNTHHHLTSGTSNRLVTTPTTKFCHVLQSLIDPSTHMISPCRPLSFSNVSKKLSSSCLCSLSQIEAAVEQTLMLLVSYAISWKFGSDCLTFSDTLGRSPQSFSSLSTVTRSYRISSKNEQSLQCNLYRNKLRQIGSSEIKGFIEVRGYWMIKFANCYVLRP